MSKWIKGVSHDYRKRHRPGRRPARKEGLIIALDGEGRPAGPVVLRPAPERANSFDELRSQDYFLMEASDAESKFTSSLSAETGRLSTEEIFAWLTELPRDALLIGYGIIGYDRSMWLADLSLAERLELKDRNSRRHGNVREGRISFDPYRWRDWEIDQFGSCFRVRRAGSKRWTTVWDVIKCYQRKFLTTLEAWFPECDKAVHDLIEEEKSRRGGDEKNLATQSAYCSAECATLAEIHTRYRKVLWDHGIRPRSWHGASIAKCMLRLNKVDRHYMTRQRIVHEDGSSEWNYEEHPVYGRLDRKAYVGARFEISAHGPVPGPIYEEDLTSAYPHWERQLPSLAGARWEHTKSRAKALKHDGWFLARVSWDARTDPPQIWGPFPYRTEEALQFPLTGAGWIWSPEIRAVQQSHPEIFTLHEAWLLHPATDERPFAYIEDTFRLRGELEALGKSRGDPIKVGMNSTYGALAERTQDTPKWQNHTYAGMITSGVRSQILDAIYPDQDNVLAIATDAVYLRKPWPHIGHKTLKTLGSWEQTRHDAGWFFARSGVLLPMGKGKIKSRGIPSKSLGDALPAFLEAWESDGVNGSVTVRTQRFFGFEIGCIRPDYWNRWVDLDLNVNLTPEPKRRNPEMRDGIMRSWPILSPGFSFADIFGGEEEKYLQLMDELDRDQPDWTR